jgi:carboxypeptidase PM20D1
MADPSVDALLRTTQAVTILRSGEVANVIPAEARAVVNVRLLPGDTTAAALARIERTARKALAGSFSLHVGFVAGETLSEPVAEALVGPALWKAVEDSVLLVEPNAVIAPFLVIGTTDSRLFAPLTDAIIRFMPVTMSSQDLARIHGMDERISLENYGRMIAFYGNVIRVAGGGSNEREREQERRFNPH